jgi:hypothetical protein
MVDSEPLWDQSFREVGLVTLQAAVLTRRIFLAAARRDDLAPEQWQILLALALIDTAPYNQSVSSESLAVQLSLDREFADELLFELLSESLITAVEEDEEDLEWFRLTKRGWEAARAYTERAGRFLPGWPPERVAFDARG